MRFILLGVSTLLMGCMSPVTDRIDESNKKIDATNEQIIDTNKTTKLLVEAERVAAALSLYSDEGAVEWVRGAAAETLMRYGQEERLHRYFGMPMLYQIGKFKIVLKNEQGQDIVLVEPNVVYVADGEAKKKLIKEKKIIPVNASTYEIIKTMTQNQIDTFILASRNPTLPSAKEDEIKSYAPKFIYMATAILGARIFTVETNGNLKREKIIESQGINEYAEKLRVFASTYLLPESVQAELEDLIEWRMKQ